MNLSIVHCVFRANGQIEGCTRGLIPLKDLIAQGLVHEEEPTDAVYNADPATSVHSGMKSSQKSFASVRRSTMADQLNSMIQMNEYRGGGTGGNLAKHPFHSLIDTRLVKPSCWPFQLYEFLQLKMAQPVEKGGMGVLVDIRYMAHSAKARISDQSRGQNTKSISVAVKNSFSMWLKKKEGLEWSASIEGIVHFGRQPGGGNRIDLTGGGNRIDLTSGSSTSSSLTSSRPPPNLIDPTHLDFNRTTSVGSGRSSVTSRQPTPPPASSSSTGRREHHHQQPTIQPIDFDASQAVFVRLWDDIRHGRRGFTRSQSSGFILPNDSCSHAAGYVMPLLAAGTYAVYFRAPRVAGVFDDDFGFYANAKDAGAGANKVEFNVPKVGSTHTRLQD